MTEQFLRTFFDFLNERNIPFAIMRSYLSLPEKICSTDIDMVVRKKDIRAMLVFLFENHFRITGIWHHVGVLHIHIFLSPQEQIQFDLMYELNHYGVTYIEIEDVLARRIAYKNFYAVSEPDEYILNLIPHFFYTGTVKEKYTARQQQLYERNKKEVDILLKKHLGSTTKWSQNRFLWKERKQLIKMRRHYFGESYKILFQPYLQTVVFLGIDHEIRTTILKRLWEQNIVFTKSRSYSDFMAQSWHKDHPYQAPAHSRKIQKKPLSYYTMLMSIQKIWRDHILRPQRNSHLNLFDRYIHDAAINPSQHHITKSRLLALFPKFFPRPTVFVLLRSDIKTLTHKYPSQSTETLKKQQTAYLEFAAEQRDRTLLIDANGPLDDVLENVIETLSQYLSQRSYKALRKEYLF